MENILIEKNVPKEYWEDCYLSDNMVFPPIYNLDGVKLKTGIEVYNIWLEENKVSA